MAETAAEMLSLVNAAITDLLSGNLAEMSIGGRSYKYNDLGELRRWRSDLEGQVAAWTGGTAGGSMAVATFRKPS